MQYEDLISTKQGTSEQPVVISMKDVSVRYGKGDIILSDINFHIRQKQFYFLTGPSGAGKTTLIRLIYNLHKQCAGRITLFNKNTIDLTRDELAELRRHMGIVFQGYCLINSMSVFDNIALPLKIIKRPSDEIKKRVFDILDWIGMKKFARANPKTLSGGQQQKVAVARAIITNPKILIADEPTGNLDDDSAKKLMQLFVDLNEKLGTTIIIATHSKKLMEEYRYPRIYVNDKQVKFKKPYGEDMTDLTKTTDISDVVNPAVNLNNIFQPQTKKPDVQKFYNSMMERIEKQNEKFSDALKNIGDKKDEL